MKEKPLFFDFFGRLSMEARAQSPFYRPVLTLLARTFAAFACPDRPVQGSRLIIRIGGFVPDLDLLHVVDGCYYIGKDRIYCRYRHKIARWQIEITGLEGPETVLRVSGNLFSFLVFPYESIHQLLLFKLGGEGAAFLHSLGVVRDGLGTLIIGRSGVGKSTLGGKFVRDGWRLLGEDTVFLDAQGRILGFPLPIGLRKLSAEEYGVRMGPSDRFIFLILRAIRMATLGRIALLFKMSPRRLGTDRLAADAPLDQALLALPGDASALERVEDAEAWLDQVLACSKFETPILAKLLEAYAYIHPDSGAGRFFDRQRDILRAGFARGRLYRARIPGAVTEPVFSGLVEAMKHG